MISMSTKAGKIDKAVIFFCIPIVGAFLAYVYELGYGSYFGIPRELISIDLFYSLLIPILFMAVITVLYFGLKMALITVSKRIIKIGLFLVISFIYFLIPPFSFPIYTIVIVWLYYILLEVIIGVNIQSQENDELAVVKETIIFKKGFFSKSEPRKPMIMVVLIIIGLFLITFAFNWLGKSEASRKDKFLVVEDTKKTIAVVKAYNDKLVCIPLDRKNRPSYGKIIVLDVNGDLEREYILKEIGPFKPAPKFQW
jgi:hypothetical protein